jgi:hypothetical protein
MEIKRSPYHSCAEPTLEPRRPLQADIAERSYVVAPDRDQWRTIHFVSHKGHCTLAGTLPAVGYDG